MSRKKGGDPVFHLENSIFGGVARHNINLIRFRWAKIKKGRKMRIIVHNPNTNPARGLNARIEIDYMVLWESAADRGIRVLPAFGGYGPR